MGGWQNDAPGRGDACAGGRVGWECRHVGPRIILVGARPVDPPKNFDGVLYSGVVGGVHMCWDGVGGVASV